jgi:hypothetical protein
MATNRELKAEIETLGVELGVSVETQRMNNAQLVEKLDELRALSAAAAVAAEPEPRLFTGEATKVVTVDAVGDAAADDAAAFQAAVEEARAVPARAVMPAWLKPALVQTEIDTASPGRSDPPKPNTATVGRYTVAGGVMLSHTLRGKIGAFQPVKARDLHGGQDELDDLVRAGHVVRS